MRRPLIAGNWKLNLGPGAAGALASYLARELGARHGVDVAVFPTALSIGPVVAALSGTAIGVGVQEIAAMTSDAMTGANSAVMAREAGCTWALVGHSERRQHFGETDAGVRAKTRAALDAGLSPIVCVGETLDERRTGRVQPVILRQLEQGLAGFDAAALSRVTLAYEPVWAIGTGETASPAQAQQVHGLIRAWLYSRLPRAVGDGLRILYGGSVKPGNAKSLLSQADIDGALVGGASLQVGAFAAIADAAG
ncbi:MAG: triose-phosphate isomerase [Proteobacteria bacterium]|nr:MAG: triose-phosphate isomerase [Pseudomonadota bacterium]